MPAPNTQDGVRVVVDPLSCLHDEPVTIRATGLQAGQRVTLQSAMKDTKGINFTSYAHYTADSEGLVDVGKMESEGGIYKGVFPMGLIGTLQPAPGEYKYTRFFKRDVENPNLVEMSIHEGHLSGEELCGPSSPSPLASVTHQRHYMGPGVQRIPVRYGKVRGCLFLPQGPGPFPGVVDMFGTAGGLLEYRSAQLASRGIAALALAFFAYDDLPKTLEEFNISYFEEAVEFLLKHDKIVSRGVGVIGTSKGGDLALSLAAFIPEVLACVTINGCNAPLSVGMRVGDQVYPPIPSWDYDKIRISDKGVVELRNASMHPSLFKELALPVDRSNAAFLFIVGSDDQDLNSELYAQDAVMRLGDNNYPKEYEVFSLPGTGHLVEPPYSSHCYASFQHAQMMVICWGGTAKYHILGQEKAWVKTLDFLKYHLAEQENSVSDKITPNYNTLLSKL